MGSGFRGVGHPTGWMHRTWPLLAGGKGGSSSRSHWAGDKALAEPQLQPTKAQCGDGVASLSSTGLWTHSFVPGWTVCLVLVLRCVCVCLILCECLCKCLYLFVRAWKSVCACECVLACLSVSVHVCVCTHKYICVCVVYM